jgi:CheY-like chemotaxis protein
MTTSNPCRSGPAAGKGLRVLVVDDFPDTARVSCTLLSLLGFETRSALSGASALEEAARFDPHVVLLDLDLPDIHGYDVARTIRKERGQVPYMAAVTGWSRPEKLRAALEAGFDQFVLKPTDGATLQRILQLAEAHFSTTVHDPLVPHDSRVPGE